jgi:hypothetical protein
MLSFLALQNIIGDNSAAESKMVAYYIYPRVLTAKEANVIVKSY